MQARLKRSTSLSTAIFLPNFVISIVALVALSVVLTMVVGKLTTNSVDDRLQTTQRLFLETVSQDYLTGSHALVYRKCKALVSDKLVKAVKITSPTGQTICDVAAEGNRASWDWINTAIYYDEAQTQIAAQISLGYSTTISRQIFLNSILIIIAAIVVTALVQLLLSRKLAVSVAAPITTLADALNKDQPHESAVPAYEGSVFRDIREVGILFESIQKLFQRINEYQKQLVTKTRQAAVGEMAAQVAHDIRSPLAALESVVADIDQLPEEHRILVRSATSRVRDIANDLLGRKRKLDKESSGAIEADDARAEDVSVWLLSGLVDSLVSEARFQFRSRIGIEINATLGSGAYGLFARVNQAKFKAILSNLINNSVDAIESTGQITVTVGPDDAAHLLITVEDSGKGIHTETLPTLMQEGKSSKGDKGSGLGLYGARLAVESWGGRIHIDSAIGKGTTVTIRLPRAAAPAWFVPNLSLSADDHVVVLDDDSSIHQVWQNRFDSSQGKVSKFTVHHVTSPQELDDWISDHRPDLATTTFLVDFELLGYKESGLDLIEKHHIGERSILVTSRNEDKAILDRLEQLRVRLIPKSLAPFIPILVTNTDLPVANFNCVLIDDDSMTHKTWKLAVKKTANRLAYFFSASDFLARAAEFDRTARIYIDSNLGNGVRGEEISKEIFALGFQEIYLITGHSQAEFPPLPHIRAIRGKEPPW